VVPEKATAATKIRFAIFPGEARRTSSTGGRKMSREKRVKLTKRSVEGLEASGDARLVFYDTEITGLCVRVSCNSRAFYYVYRAEKGRGAAPKWLRLGTFPTMTVETARQKAKAMAAAVQLGGDPAQELKERKLAESMKALLHKFFDEHVSKLKKSSEHSYTNLVEKFVIPPIGKMKVEDIQFSHIAKLHSSMNKTPYNANRTIAILSKFFNWCELHGYRERNSNPVKGITRYKEYKRQEFMGEYELSLLGKAISDMEKTWYDRQDKKIRRQKGESVDTITPQSAAAIRLLMFTGARLGEILSLEWDNLNLEKGVARLQDSKTGFKILKLPTPAVAILDSLPKISHWVFPATSASGHQVDLKCAWTHVLHQAGLTGWRIHDLRHAFASVMVNSGASLPVVGKILGHTQVSTTARYAHLEENPAHAAAEKAAALINEYATTPRKRAAVFHLKERA
jgi:integrase